MPNENCLYMILGFLLFASVLLPAGMAAAETGVLFEDVRVVELPKGDYGYRGMPGTIVELQDGRLLLAYSQILPDGTGGRAIAMRDRDQRYLFD